MAIIGIQTIRENPEFTASDFTTWMPQFSNYVATTEGTALFNKMKDIADNKIFKSIYGSDWEFAMSLCIAHYLTIVGQQQQAPSGSSLAQVAGGGTYKGIVTSMSVGNFSKSYDMQYGAVSSEEAKFWNQTSYGAQLMSLLKTKAIPSIFVVTSNPLPGAN